MTPEGGIVMDDRIADMSPPQRGGERRLSNNSKDNDETSCRITDDRSIGRFGDGVRVDRAVFGARGRCDASGGIDRNDILRVIDAWR